MPYLGCHLSVARGWKRMGEDALSIGADAFQFFTRNPRGSRAKTLTQEDVDGLRHILAEGGFGLVMGHASYTLNPAAADPLLRDYARRDMADDLRRMENLPGNLYNFHPGAHWDEACRKAPGWWPTCLTPSSIRSSPPSSCWKP